MPSASASHRRVEPSTSVNRNVTTPEGAGTSAECHNGPCSLAKFEHSAQISMPWHSITINDQDAKKHSGNILETLISTYIKQILTRRPEKPEFTNF
jgi:hypothetical protein